MSTTTTTTAQARATLETARKARDATRAELHRIAAAIKNETPAVEAARAALEAARSDFQNVAAAHALGEVEKAAVDAVRAELKQREKDHDTAQSAAANLATVSDGIRRRLDAAHEADAKAGEAVTRAENALILAELIEADRTYTKAAHELAKHAGRVLACAALLKHRDPSLVPAATSSCIGLPSLPTIGPVSAAVVLERSKGREHGIRAFLVEARHIWIDAQTYEVKLLMQTSCNCDALIL